MAPEGLAGRPVSSAFPATVIPAPDAMVSAPAAVKVDLTAPAPNWASPATSRSAPGDAAPTPKRPVKDESPAPVTRSVWSVRVTAPAAMFTYWPGGVEPGVPPAFVTPSRRFV